MTAAMLWQKLSLRKEPVFISILLGLFFVVYAIRLWAEGDTFKISTGYSWFEQHVTEETAGWILFVPGMITLAAPLINRKWLDVTIAGILAILCCMIAGGFRLGSHLSGGQVTWMFLAAPLACRLMWCRWLG